MDSNNNKNMIITYRKDKDGNVTKEVKYYSKSWLSDVAAFLVVVGVFAFIAFIIKISLSSFTDTHPELLDKLYIAIPIIIVLFNIVAIYVTFVHRKRVKVNKKDQGNNNNYANENQSIIEKNMDINREYLKPIKTKIILTAILYLTVTVLTILFVKDIFFSILICSLTALPVLFYVKSYNDDYEEKYNEMVKNIIKNIDSGLDYRPDSKIFHKDEYLECIFPERCEFLASEDTIMNLNTGFCFSDIASGYMRESDDGHTYAERTFSGSLARENIQNVNCKILLGATKNSFNKIGFVKINFENDEFNKMFSAYADNEVLAYKVLTPDIMEVFTDIKNNISSDVEIRIIYDKLYVRFHSGNVFEDVALSKTLEKKALIKSISVLEKVMKTMDKAKNAIDKKTLQ